MYKLKRPFLSTILELVCAVIVTSSILFVAYLFNDKWFNSEPWQWFDAFVTLLTLCLVLLDYRNRIISEKKENELVEIFFRVDGQKEEYPRFKIIRKNVTRAEIAGYLSFIQKDSKNRYNIPYMMTEDFFNDIHDIQRGEKDELIIEMDKEEEVKFGKITKNDSKKSL